MLNNTYVNNSMLQNVENGSRNKFKQIQTNKYRINKITSLFKNLFQDNKKKD